MSKERVAEDHLQNEKGFEENGRVNAKVNVEKEVAHLHVLAYARAKSVTTSSFGPIGRAASNLTDRPKWPFTFPFPSL
ncbi:MAG: hypothetical protein E5X76_31810 [Mesorhizobium sp.]|nr:MAG: hypothetical protein E5X77_26920 [Mesorhizobium sp.]TJV67921.1 MAG: hypothetical protein E5X76_31810 [Mesorhizobium sp.]